MKVVVTGASGVLGSAVYDTFKSSGHDVVGLAHTRSSEQLRKLDLCDFNETDTLFKQVKPDWVIHCAGERRPDVAEKDPVGIRKLNVDVPIHLATLSRDLNFILVYISTDYVFDGCSPPYRHISQPNPINVYGKTKYDGEAVLEVDRAMCFVLRVPVLYGPAPKNSDSAINILLDVVQDQSGKQYKVDHYATRYPTNVLDVARFLVRMTGVSPPAIPHILHYSAQEPYTKYEICLLFAKILQLPVGHIIPDDAAPQGNDPLTRPKNCKLHTKESEEMVGLDTTGFEEWWTERLLKNN